MRCLWITPADPDPPHNGQFVYSGGLIKSAAAAGAAMTVLARSRLDSARRDGAQEDGVLWRLVGHRQLPRWTSLGSPLPNLAHRFRTSGMNRMLRALLREGGWDAIVLDGISSGWALAPVVGWCRGQTRPPKLIYVSHNHEGSLRPRLAECQHSPLLRYAMRADAGKVARLEREMVDEVDMITAITPEDAESYRRDWPNKPVEVVLPGFGHTMPDEKPLAANLPRRAVLVGSFDWIAKRMNLEDFVRVADPLFAAEGIELVVVGNGEKPFLDRMRRRVVTTRFLGPVESIQEHVRDARVAVVAEFNGGGFKLKALEYVFSQLPILALRGSVAGMPLRDRESILLYPDQESLARGVIDTIDDLDRLNGLRQSAWAACRDCFHWQSRGAQLVSAMAA